MTEPNAPTQDWIKIGIIGKAHGLRGAFFVSARETPIPADYKTVLIGRHESDAREYDILESRMQSGRPLLRASIAADRTVADTLTGLSLWVRRAQIRVDHSREYLWSDLLNRPVVDSDNAAIGVSIDLYNTGATDVLTIRRADGKTCDIPVVGTYFVMDFAPGQTPLRLTVPASTFDDTWQ